MCSMVEKKVDEVICRLKVGCKAIRFYCMKYHVVSSIEMDEVQKYHKVVKTEGEGQPTILIDKKWNKKRGEEIDLVFVGRRNIELLEKDSRNWITFGHIVLSPEQAIDLAYKLFEVCNAQRVEKKEVKSSVADYM